MTITVQPQQNVFDLAVQYYGSAAYAGRIIQDNGLTWSAPLEAGDQLQVFPDLQGEAQIKSFFTLSGRQVVNQIIPQPKETAPTFDSTVTRWDEDAPRFDSKP